MLMNSKKTALSLAASIMLAHSAFAGETIHIGDDIELDWSLTTSYNLAMRVAKPDPLLTGETYMWANRYNDGNNNFDRGSLVNNRASALLQTKISKGPVGFVLNGSTFYDHVYHQKNDNRADKFHPVLNNGALANVTQAGVTRPASVNQSTVNPHGKFTREAKRLHGGYSRFLDAYAYGNFDIGTTRANVKVGSHVVSWGESLFFPNISMAQGPLDGSKANVPGTEIKEIMLPEEQISFSWQLSPTTTLLGHYQWDWHETIIDAPGSYLSRSDIVGPGGYCLGDYVGDGNKNYVAADCILPPDGKIPETGNTFTTKGGYFGGDIKPKKNGSAGIGLRQRISDETELGFYYLRYHERVPLPLITYQGPVALQRIPITWERLYQPNIHLTGASFTTSLGEYVVGGEIAHRRGAPVLAGGDRDPNRTGFDALWGIPYVTLSGSDFQIYAPTTANLTQLNLNTFANFGRTFLAPRTLLLGEVAWVHVSGFKPVQILTRSPCGDTGPGQCVIADKLRMYEKNNIGFQTRFQLDYPGIADGWDLSVPISYGQQLKGQNMLSNLGSKGDKILGVSTEFTRGNLQLNASYVNWLGKPSTDDFGSRILTDRDFVSVGVKYTF